MKAVRSGLKRLESDDGVRVLDAGDALYLLIDEVTDVRAAVDVEFHQQDVVARGRIDLGCNFCLGQGVGHLVGLSEFAFDLNEKGGHHSTPEPVRNPAKTWVAGKRARPDDRVAATALLPWDRARITYLNSNLVGCPATCRAERQKPTQRT